MQAFEKKGKLQLPVKHVLLRFLTAPFVFLVGRLFQNIVRLKSLSAFHFSFLHVLKRFARLKIYALLLLFGGLHSFNVQGQTYCSPSISAACAGSYGIINDFSLSNLSQTATGCSSGYTNYTGSTAINMNAGQAYTFTISTGNVFGSKFGFWIDLNSDGDFADANEFLGNFTFTSSQSPTGSITIPAAAAGNLRLRVIGTYGSSSVWSSAESCGGKTYGEAHDYTANITGGSGGGGGGGGGTSGTGFSDCYVPANWSLQQISGGNGSVNTSGAPSSIVFTGTNGGSGRITRYQITIPTSGTIGFNWSTAAQGGYCCGDASFGYRINSTDYFLTNAAGTGTVSSVAVNAGDVFSFYTSYAWVTSATLVTTISNFTRTCPASCTAPTSQATIGSYTNNVSPGTSLTVNWSRGTPSPGNEVIVVGRLTATANVAPTSGTTYTANAAFGTAGTTTGTGNFVVYKGTGTSVNVTALTAGTSYTFTVYEYNSTGTCYKTPGSSSAVTTWAPPTYCTPVTQTPCTANWDMIDALQIGTGGSVYNGPSTGCTAGGYNNQTAVTINFTQGITYPFNISTVRVNGVYDYLGIWIDLNDDGDFLDASEFLGNYTSTSSTAFSGNFTIAAGAATGNHRMRFRGVYTNGSFSGFTASSTSCESVSYGETQDYTANISAAASCTAPNGTVSFGAFSGVTSSATTTNVTYTNGANTATGYVLLRNTTNSAPTAPASGTAVPTAGSTSFVSGYTVVNTTTTIASPVAFNSSGLSASTIYYYWVVAYQNTNGPCWFRPTTQTSNSQATSATCVAPATPATPTGSQTGVCSGTSYTYNVTAVAGATSYDWTLPPGWTAASTNTATNSITATAGSSGFLSVRANNCGGSSAYSSNLGISVTTSPTISFPEGQTVYTGCRILITANPSSPSFSLSGGIGTSSSGGITYLTGSSVVASSVQATSGGCSSPVYTITVTAGITNRGTLASGDQTICDGQTPSSIAYSSAATGTGITYQWYYKNTNATCPATNDASTGWTIISGAQSNSYSPAQGFVPAGSTYTFACYVGSSLGSCGGWSSGCRKITVNSIPSAPTGSASQSFCSAASPTVAALSATGTAIQWYDAATNGSLLASSAALTNGTSYYASQTVSGCESTNRLAVAVTVTTTPSAPTGSASQSFCSAANPTVASLSATGTTILWYAASSGGSSLATSTALTNSTSYYASQTVSGCESTNRLAVAAVLNANGTWIGGTSSDWGNTANWCGGVPASGANILFSPSAVNNLVLDQNRTVGNVDFNGTSRSIHLGAYDLTTSGIISNYSASSYVKSAGTGKLIATLVDGATFIFPIGNTSYNPLSIKNTTGASDAFSVGLKDAVYLNGSSGTTISTPHVSRTWDISKTNANAGTGVDLIFNWNTGDVSGTLVDPRMNHHTGNGWEIPTTITSSTAGTNTLTVVGYTGTFSPFAIGEGSSPLPVELLSFQANCIDQGVALTWQTASEHSSAYFEVDRSEDSQNWSLLEQVAAAGNSTSLLSYSILDSEKVRKTVYYRLNQVDFDGANKRYNPIYMNCGNIGNVITTYPNPSTDNGFQLLFENSLGERIIGLNILDALGNLVYTKELQLQNGTNTFNVYDFKVETGVYFLQIKEADGVTSLIKHVHFSK